VAPDEGSHGREPADSAEGQEAAEERNAGHCACRLINKVMESNQSRDMIRRCNGLAS